MGFLKKLFGGGSEGGSSDAGQDGFFVYVQCDHCQKKVRLRIIKGHDLNFAGDGFVWHKTIVDSRCFQQIPAVVHFDRNLNMTNAEISGGHFITKEEYDQPESDDGKSSGTAASVDAAG